MLPITFGVVMAGVYVVVIAGVFVGRNGVMSTPEVESSLPLVSVI